MRKARTICLMQYLQRAPSKSLSRAFTTIEKVKVKSKVCTKNLECLTIKCRPFYLPREFSSISLTAVYIHPNADISDALHDLSDIVTNNEKGEPDTVSIVLGDFNQANLRTNLPNYHQVVTCPTRKDKILDHCYT